MEFLADNWLYFLYAGLMAFMMFKGGGCCGGHSHNKNSNTGGSNGGCCSGKQNGDKNNENQINQKYDNNLDIIKDPVCGMIVNPDTAIKQKIDGKTYYFCSEHCRAQFVKMQNSK